MKLLSAATALLPLLASAAASEQALHGPVTQHESVWTPEFPLAPTANKFTTIPLFGDLSSTKPFNFYGNVAIGTPPQHFKLHMSTTESVLSIPNFKPPPSSHHAFYNHNTSSSYEADGAKFGFGSGVPLYAYSGYFSRDTIRFGDFELSNLRFIEVTEVFRPVNFTDLEIDGMFGLGPNLNFNSTLLRLLRSKAISEPVFTFHFNKSQEGGGLRIGESPARVGEVMIGAIDKRHYSGRIHYVVTMADYTWMINLDAVTVHDNSVVDRPDTLLARVLPSFPFIQGPIPDIEKLAKATGVTEGGIIDCSSKGPDIVIKIDGAEYTLTKDEYTRRIDKTTCQWVFTGQDIDVWYLGQPFLQKYFSVFVFADEQSNKAHRIGFALAT